MRFSRKLNMRVPTSGDWRRWAETRRRCDERVEREHREREDALKESPERAQSWYDEMYRRWTEHERERDQFERAEPLLAEEDEHGTFLLLVRPDGKLIRARVIRRDNPGHSQEEG